MRRLPMLPVLLAGILAIAACGGVPRCKADRPGWPDTHVSRVQALAILQTLNAELLSNPSATLTLDRWCASHRLAPTGEKIVAERVRGRDRVPDADVRARLEVGPDEPVGYRRVRLKCGLRVLSEADNWYVPGRLTAGMNAQLESTDIAFGRVVAPLGFSRTTLSARLLWRPLPEGWEMRPTLPPSHAPGKVLVPPPFLIEHRAVLKLRDGTPISALVETYTSEVLAFPAPRQ